MPIPPPSGAPGAVAYAWPWPVAAVGLGVGVGLALGGVAFAYWIGSATSGSNYAEATAQTLPTGATPTGSVTPVANQTVTIDLRPGKRRVGARR